MSLPDLDLALPSLWTNEPSARLTGEELRRGILSLVGRESSGFVQYWLNQRFVNHKGTKVHEGEECRHRKI